MLKLYNSLTRKIEDFVPLSPPQVGMYTCGPTVYDYMHIGNLRTFIFSDILRRTLLANGYQVTAVENITDIDDKVINKAKEKNLSTEELTKKYTNFFLQDLRKLNILPANVYSKATWHIQGMIKYTENLIKKGFAYVEKDGSVYFDISKFSDYGKLSQLDKRQLRSGTRILSDEYTKDNVQDFALWKATEPNETGYDSPWGKGRPGWHIECSVMSQEYLGETFDIHAGGIDLLFPHHENEIAQSEAKTGKKFANYFVHGEHLLVDGAKMSKSLGNFHRLKGLEERRFNPLSFRYLVLTAHYRDKLNFTWQSLEAAQHALNNLREEIRKWPSFSQASEGKKGNISVRGLPEQPKSVVVQFWQKFMEAANNDLNMPRALAVLWKMVKSDLSSSDKAATLFKMDKILGLKLDEYLGRPLRLPEEVKKLVEEREQIRKNEEFERADQLRKEIKKLGFEVDDTPSGPKIRKTNNTNPRG